MSAVVRTEECPSRSEMVGRSTPLSASWLAWLWRRTWSEAPLGNPACLQIRDTVPDTEFGFSGVPSELAKIRSRAFRGRATKPPIITGDDQDGAGTARRGREARFSYNDFAPGIY